MAGCAANALQPEPTISCQVMHAEQPTAAAAAASCLLHRVVAGGHGGAHGVANLQVEQREGAPQVRAGTPGAEWCMWQCAGRAGCRAGRSVPWQACSSLPLPSRHSAHLVVGHQHLGAAVGHGGALHACRERSGWGARLVSSGSDGRRQDHAPAADSREPGGASCSQQQPGRVSLAIQHGAHTAAGRTRHDTVDGVVNLALADTLLVAAARQDGSLVQQVGQVGTCGEG